MRKYVIVSLKHSSEGTLVFWRANDNGYTSNPWEAGEYTEQDVTDNPNHYNDGTESIAVELSSGSLYAAGLVITPNLTKLKSYHKSQKK